MSNMTGEVPRQKLKELVAKNGDSLLEDPDRCEGLLKDHCGAYRREISALVGALEERIPSELKSSWQSAMTPEAMRARLVQRLEENRGLAPEVASWAVDAWSYALGVGLTRHSDRVEAAAGLSGAGAAGGTWAAPGTLGTSMAEQVASDRVGVAATQPGSAPLATPPAPQLSTPRKAGIGAAALLAVGVAALAIIGNHHPTPASNPAPTPASSPAPSPIPPGPTSPAPVVDPKTDPKTPDTKNGPPADGRAKDSVATNIPPSPKFLPTGTIVTLRLDDAINSDTLVVGELVPATVSAPITTDGNVVVATGAKAQVQVTAIDRTAKEGGSEHMQLELVDLTTEKGPVHVTTAAKQFDGPAFHMEQAKHGGIGAATGAVGGFVGKIFHHGGAGTAAGAGGGAGGGGATTKPGPVKVALETPLQFRLSASVKAPLQTTAKK